MQTVAHQSALLRHSAGVFAIVWSIASGVADANAAEHDTQWSHFGLLRGRDLTPFGLLRLDMLPAHTADAQTGTWTFEAQYAYQNTFVLSGNVRRYLEGRNLPRQPLRPEDAAAIQALPGDAFYVDGEVGLADLIIQRRLSNYWSAYLTIPYINYGQGAFDSTIESFHDTFGFRQQGRDLVARNQFQIVYSIGANCPCSIAARQAASAILSSAFAIRCPRRASDGTWSRSSPPSSRSTASASCYPRARTTLGCS
jgi:hypothetical protein